MKRTPPAATPDAYVAALDGWRRKLVGRLRAAVCSSARLEEVVKWGHLVYLGKGPVLLIRAEETRVLFGFWRGQRLTRIEPRLKAGGKYEMATLDLREGMPIAPATARRLAREAAALDRKLGNAAVAAPKAKEKANAPPKPKAKPPARPGKGKDPLVEFCRSLPGATEDVKWGADLIFSVGGKMFAGFQLPDGDPLGFKVDPAVFGALVGRKGVIPAPYMAKHSWVSVTDRKQMPLATLQDLLAESHRLVAGKLSGKARRELGL
jgi:predicted DNA-binding protein (MmcQ/YjbR family)